uniref:Putative glycosyltransferase n=1 Tax=viral metagenome TaxID=1070528 RepID=A0A6M3XDL3_9ZZZZ
MKDKIVVLVGVLDNVSSTNVSMAKAFMAFNYSVVPVNYRTIINKYGMLVFEELLLHTIQNYKPEFVLFSKTNGINPELITKCNKYTKTFYWFMDSITVAASAPYYVEYAKNANYVSCTGGGVAQWFTEQTGKPCYHIFDGGDIDIFKPVEQDEEYIADISFIGGKTTERDYFKDVLENLDLDIKFYGNGYGKEVINEEFAKVCASSKLMLSLNTFNDVPDYFSNRLLRYMGCGSCVLHLDRTETLNKYFTHMQNIVFFKNEEELIDNINYLINNPDEITKIGINSRDLVINKYTWYNSMNAVLNIVR